MVVKLTGSITNATSEEAAYAKMAQSGIVQ